MVINPLFFWDYLLRCNPLLTPRPETRENKGGKLIQKEKQKIFSTVQILVAQSTRELKYSISTKLYHGKE